MKQIKLKLKLKLTTKMITAMTRHSKDQIITYKTSIYTRIKKINKYYVKLKHLNLIIK